MNLTTRYLGLTLRNPLVASASPLNISLDNIRRLEDCGAGAIVLPSIFEEQIERERQLIERLAAVGTDSHSEAASYFPPQTAVALDSGHHLEVIRRAVAAVDIPIIASLNGSTNHGWVRYARQVEQAGASAIELNIYLIASELDIPGSEIEQRYLEIVQAVKATVDCPVAVKIGPYFSAMGNMARRLDQAGADGLVLFNRFHAPDIDLARLTLVSHLELSSPYEIGLPLLWIAVLHGQLRASLAASTGVEGVAEVMKFLLAGADVVMTTSALLRHGIEHLRSLRAGLEAWLTARNLDSLDAIRGCMSRVKVADPSAYDRANYIKTLQDYDASLRSTRRPAC